MARKKGKPDLQAEPASDQSPAEAPAAAEMAPKVKEPAPFPVVGVGASAGGLEAFTQLLQALPADSGMAFVLVVHLDPTHGSMMAEILSRATSMPVMQVVDEPKVEPNHVYVIPPNRHIVVSDGY